MKNETNNPSEKRFAWPRISGRAYTNGVLTVVAAILAGHMMSPAFGDGGVVGVGGGGGGGAPAPARSGGSMPVNGSNESDMGDRISAAEQRKMMIAELRNISARMDRIEAKLSEGINVRVTDMPPIQFPAEKK